MMIKSKIQAIITCAHMHCPQVYVGDMSIYHLVDGFHCVVWYASFFKLQLGNSESGVSFCECNSSKNN